MSDPRGGDPPPSDAGAIETCAEAERFQRDLYLYWQAVAASEGLPLSARGALTRAALRRVRARLAAAEGDQLAMESAEAEDGRTLFLRRLLERLTLLKREERAARLVAAPVAEMERFLALSLGERLRACAKVWIAGGWWPDTPDPRAEPPRLMTPASPRVAVARRRLLDFLAASPGSEHPLPMPRTHTQPGGGSAKRASSRSGGRAGETSVAGDEQTWHAALTGPLAWLGFVAPARAESPAGAGRARYHVTEAARVLSAEGDPAPLHERKGQVTIQSDFSIVAYPPLQPRTLLALDRCADEVALERTARYTLGRASFARARRAGLDAASVAAMLQAQSGTPLPQPV
ncbi:MAG TPA: helicase-associated domain-containing protein, partial [Ktedonobacterales bacterium]|nr:helicase-associated domain-containing protein [Ktedonobacterales bacterium]